MPEPENVAKPLATPDPALSTEAIAALIVAVLTNVIVLFKLDLDEGQKAAAISLVNSLVVIGYFVHGLYVRGKRNGTIQEQIAAEATVAAAQADAVSRNADPAVLAERATILPLQARMAPTRRIRG